MDVMRRPEVSDSRWLGRRGACSGGRRPFMALASLHLELGRMQKTKQQVNLLIVRP